MANRPGENLRHPWGAEAGDDLSPGPQCAAAGSLVLRGRESRPSALFLHFVLQAQPGRAVHDLLAQPGRPGAAGFHAGDAERPDEEPENSPQIAGRRGGEDVTHLASGRVSFPGPRLDAKPDFGCYFEHDCGIARPSDYAGTAQPEPVARARDHERADRGIGPVAGV